MSFDGYNAHAYIVQRVLKNLKLLKKMDYKIYEKEKDLFIKYLPLKKKIKKKVDKKDYSNNPFSILDRLNLK